MLDVKVTELKEMKLRINSYHTETKKLKIQVEEMRFNLDKKSEELSSCKSLLDSQNIDSKKMIEQKTAEIASARNLIKENNFKLEEKEKQISDMMQHLLAIVKKVL